MIELGRLALIGCLGFAAYAAAAAAYGALAGRPGWVRSSERAVYAVAALVVIAALGLEAALLSDRFDIGFVARISSIEQPWPFKLALWGGQEGSLLLWALVLAGMSALAVWQNRARNRNLMPWVIVSLMGNLLFFLVLLVFISNPFETLPPGQVLSNGQGMNPLLQHPVMLIHPPVLYLGFVGFAVPFSFALAALISGELGTTWFRTTRRWTVMAWFFLGVGLLLGGRWACCSAGAGPTRCWVGGATGPGTPSRTPHSCRGWRPPPTCIR